jgi:hypothetical protein
MKVCIYHGAHFSVLKCREFRRKNKKYGSIM